MRCHDARLRTLLCADEDSLEFRNISRHVESCSKCQERLNDLAADPNLVTEVRETLLNFDSAESWRSVSDVSLVVSVESAETDDHGAECEPFSLDFLAPASHPEMLGRLGRYEIERVIGTGGMGIVLKGYDTDLHRIVAIKVLKPHLAHNGAARRRFTREAQSAAAVVHEHVIPIYDVHTDSETPFLVMQYVPGQSLQAKVDERGPLEPAEILRIARQIAAGLAAAHAQGVVHRDVKPANILLEQSVDRVLISDFGLARTVDDATLTRTGVVAGTPHYMSPEQATGSAVDQRSDLFSLGSVIYFMCTGRPPFRAEHALAILNRICNDYQRPVEQVNSEIPGELAEVIDCLLSKNPDERLRDAGQVERSLEQLLLQLQQGRPSRRLRWRRLWLQWRSKVVRAVFVTVVLAACVAAGMHLSPWRPEDRSPTGTLPSVTNDRNADHVGSLFSAGGTTADVSGPKPVPRRSIPADLRDLLINDNFDADSAQLRSRIDGELAAPVCSSEPEYSSLTKWEIDLQSLKGQLEHLESTGKQP